jgi:tetratricopeptide (TPR) repeat protein
VQKITEVVKAKALSGPGARLVIGGPGGIGKTSLALAIFHSPELDGFFPRTQRFFIPCQSITTASTFLSAIASSLGVKISQGDALTLVIEKLKTESTPLMLVVDNAESFWFDHEIQPHARAILRHICAIPTVTLLLTIRGTECPNVTVWDPLPLLGPLSLLHARQAFLTIATNAELDASLDSLLKMVDYVPLAVSLLARRCQITGESAVTLCNRWEKEHTELLKLGGSEPDDNIDISIKLSLDSPLIRGNHDVLRLLSVVSYLPAGISEEACSSMSLPEVELSAAEFLLRRLSLTYSPTPGWITTLEPIRVYVRRQAPPLACDLDTVENWHVNLANTHGNYRPSDAEFPTASTKLTANSANISFILHALIQQQKDSALIADAVLAFSSFLYWVHPNGDLMEMLLSAKINKLDQRIKARCLRCLGDILLMQHQHEAAQLKLGDAQSEFVEVSDRLGAAQCLQSLGNTLLMQHRYKEAQSKLEEARSEFINIGNRLGAAQCLRSLGNILRMQDEYKEAQLKLEEARSEFISLGARLGAAQCLQCLGDILLPQGQHEEAQPKLEEARSEFISIGDRLGAAQCLQSLGNILRIQDQYEEARSMLEDARSEFVNIGNRLGAAQCLKILGYILQMQAQYEEALLKLETARSAFINIDNRLGAAQCLRSLGDILRMQSQYEEARPKLEEARSEFINIGNRLGAAQCLQSLGDISRMQGQLEGARSKQSLSYIPQGQN